MKKCLAIAIIHIHSKVELVVFPLIQLYRVYHEFRESKLVTYTKIKQRPIHIIPANFQNPA